MANAGLFQLHGNIHMVRPGLGGGWANPFIISRSHSREKGEAGWNLFHMRICCLPIDDEQKFKKNLELWNLYPYGKRVSQWERTLDCLTSCADLLWAVGWTDWILWSMHKLDQTIWEGTSHDVNSLSGTILPSGNGKRYYMWGTNVRLKKDC